MEECRSVVLFLIGALLMQSTCSGRQHTSQRDRAPRQSDNASDGLSGLIAHLQRLGNLYGLPDNRTGMKVAAWHPGMEMNPEELGGYAEGDILNPPARLRNGLKAQSKRWPGGVVPYIISPGFNKEQLELIREAIEDYHRYTCIKFKPYSGEGKDYIRVKTSETGCWSSIGRIGGRQDVNLQIPSCVTKKGTIIHELMHALGFLHEQSRYERDDFVEIQWPNIISGSESNFEKASRRTTEAFGIGYDYGSVMHYSTRAFSRNGQPTIVPRNNNPKSIGQRDGFSVKDIQKIRRMYKCVKQKRSNNFFFL